MTQDSLKERGRAFEAHYFNKLSQDKAKKLKEALQKEQELQDLQKQTGIEDARLLEGIMQQGIHPSQLSALTIFPVAYVAWADGKLDEKERAAIVKACNECGIDQSSPAMELIDSWLEQAVDETMFLLWTDWIKSIFAQMELDHAKGLALNIKNKARSVASASRSFLGFGAKISDSEERALLKIESALEL